MNRLLPELNRLYGLGASAADGVAADAGNAGVRDGVRAVVLAVVSPVGWEQLSAVWRGVQSDLELPAPAIAVSGRDALQLWFSFASPTSSSAGANFLQGLCDRYLSGVRPSQLRLFADPAELPSVPSVEISAERWSAFITDDLASLFAETPWLDVAPGDEGQATILRALASIGQVAFEAALDKLRAAEAAAPTAPVAPERAGSAAAKNFGQPESGPARFLTSVMNDETAPLALRIEAAKALLLRTKRS